MPAVTNSKELTSLQAIYSMCSYKRPSRSKVEKRFIRDFITNLRDSEYDKYGNRIIRVGNAPIMYSCHTDTVHKAQGFQQLAVCKGHLKLHKKDPSNCLGADNSAGVWMMTQMIQANKPGLYVFHRSEEIGCLGSKHIVTHTPELVKGIQAAIAFDRRKTSSIITHMWRGRTCSNDFANSLSKELQLGHKLDDGGTITDTGQYTDLIPECTNISVGFDHEHSWQETLDLVYLMELRESMLKMNWKNLVIARKPGEYEPREYTAWSGWTPKSSDWGEYEKYRYPKHRRVNGVITPANQIGFIPAEKQGDLLVDRQQQIEVLRSERLSEKKETDKLYMTMMIRNNAGLIADLLGDFGQTVDDVADHLFAHGGFLPGHMYSDDKYKGER